MSTSTEKMRKFWIVATSGRYNTLTERFYVYEDAVAEAEKRAKAEPRLVFNVLGLCGYAEGQETISSDYNNPLKNDIIMNKGTSAKITISFKDKDGNFIDLTDCKVQFQILPEEFSPGALAIYDETVDCDETTQQVDFIIDNTVTANPINYYYRVSIIEVDDVEVYRTGRFIVQ